MKHVIPMLLACSASLLVACSNNDNNSQPADTQNSNQTTNTDNSIPDVLSKQTSVFGITILGTQSTSNSKMLHAANVMAEYLDNDENGVADNQAIVDQMVSAKATLIIAASESKIETLFDVLPDGRAYQDLYTSEMFPNGAKNGNFDGTLEEVLHLITHTGYAREYPAVFGEKLGTSISSAMDLARGGQFTNVPESYPENAWYTYDDTTCDYNCMVTEYTYWALTSILGAQNYEGRLDEIQQEWKLNTPEELQQQDTAAHILLTDSQYALPTILPDGKYTAKAFEITTSEDIDSTALGASLDHEILQAVSGANPGYKIAFTDETQIYMMNPDGSGKETLADGSPIAGYVAWSSDGREPVLI